MGRCKGLIVLAYLILLFIFSAQSVSLGESVSQTYTLNPVDASNPTYNDNGDRISGIIRNEAWFAFDLSSLPANSTIVSAVFSAYFWNGSSVASQREIWYDSDDSWIVITDSIYGNDSDPGDDVIADELIGTFLHSELPDDGYVWKSIPISYNGWSNDIADNYISLMLTGGQYYASVGQGPTTFGENWGVDKMPELTLIVISDPTPITVTSPNGGESFQAGNPITITWYSSGGAGANVKIELYKNNSYVGDITSSTANDGEYTWVISSGLSADTTYKIKVIDTDNSSIYDYSNNNFSIINLSPSPGTLQFASSMYSVSEISGSARIYVSRTGGSSGSASVNYSTTSGTAIAGSDFMQQTGTLFWNDGDMENKYFDAPISNDGIYEGEEIFTVSLNNAIGANMGDPSLATVTISDNDQPLPTINPPVVDTIKSINIGSDTAILMGQLTYDGSDETDENCNCKFFYWKVGDKLNIQSTDVQSGINQGQYFSEKISGLEPDTEYTFYAQASNSAGTVNGISLQFTTLADPNSPPVSFNPNEPNTLLIQNFIKELMDDPNNPHDNQGLLTYVEKSGNLDDIDSNDVFFYIPASLKDSKIVSLVAMPEKKGKAAGFYELSKDARNDNPEDLLIELNISSSIPFDSNMYSENYLKFWLADNAFEGKTVTIQRISYDPNITYPLWDVNEIITNNNRIMTLDDLIDQELNTPYASFTLSTNRQILDLNEDGIIDLADYDFLLNDLDKTGISRSDIASTNEYVTIIGIPDGIVDSTDENAFISEYNEMYPDNPIPDNGVSFFEGFEAGVIEEYFASFGNDTWSKHEEAYEGIFSAKSGNITHGQASVLELTIDAPKGKISFWRKVSSELNCDELVFYIDNEIQDRWSGLQDWQKVSYQVAPGIHTLNWVYVKDISYSKGQDSAWIDNLTIK